MGNYFELPGIFQEENGDLLADAGVPVREDVTPVLLRVDAIVSANAEYDIRRTRVMIRTGHSFSINIPYFDIKKLILESDAKKT